MTMRGRNSWMRTVFLTFGMALLGLTLLAPAARAESNNGHGEAGEFLARLCRAGGGTVVVVSTPTYTVLSCYGGVYGGMGCYIGPEGTFCSGVYPHPVRLDSGSPLWPIDEGLPVLEIGAPAPVTTILADLQAANEQGPSTGPGVAGNNSKDQHHETAKSKKGKHGKKGAKHGKKGGKHRKR